MKVHPTVAISGALIHALAEGEPGGPGTQGCTFRDRRSNFNVPRQESGR